MANVLFEIDGNALAPAPAGQVFDHVDVVAVDSAGAPVTGKAVAGTNAAGAVWYTATLVIVATGAFTYTIGAVDATNAAMGTTITGTGTIGGVVPPPGVFFQPSGVKVTVS